ncbi:MAG: hypothetical protein ACKVIN_14985, partial [Longimicrobiales bacterium]
SMPAVRAISTATLQSIQANLMASTASPHAALIAMDIQRFLDRPAEASTMPGAVTAPPGSPIGQPAMDWVGNLGIGQPATEWLALSEAWCASEDHWHE